MNLKALAWCAAAAVVLSFADAGARELRLVTIAPESHNWTGIARRVAADLEAQPTLDLQLSVFPGGQLGGEPETLQQLEVGLLDMGIFTVASLVTRAPSMNGWFTPYLFGDVAQAGAARTLPAARAMLDDLGESGLVGVDFAMAGMRHILSRGAPVRDSAGVVGAKVRITPFEAARTWWQALGAVPTPVPAPALYQALQTGLVDLVETDLELVNALRLYEVTSSITLTGHMVFPAGIVISQEVFDSLTEAQQQALTVAILAATEAGLQQQIAAEETNLAAAQAHIEVIVHDPTAGGFDQGVAAVAAAFGATPGVADFVAQVGAQRP